MGIKIIKPPKKDTFINRKTHNKCKISPSKNFCSKKLPVGKDCKNLFRSLLKFDLSSLPPFLTIITGTLNLHLLRNQFSFIPKTIEVHNILSEWNEKTVSFRCQPLFDPVPISSVNLTKQQNIVVSFGLTPLIQNWYTGAEANLGIMLKMANECYNNKVIFASKEICNSKFWPYLEVDFLDPPDAPGSGGCCEPIEVTINVITDDTDYCTDPINTLMFNYTYYVINTGTAQAQAYLQTSPDGYHWAIDSAVTTINPGETQALIPDWIAKYSKLCYQSVLPGQSTTLAIYIQGRS